jgi:hypothetical protein
LLPWLFPPPAYAKRQPRVTDRLYRLLPLWLIVYGVIGFGLVGLGLFALAWASVGWRVPELLQYGLLALVAFCLVFTVVSAPPRLFFPRRRRLYRWRKQLAALLSVRYGLAPGGLALLLEDDDRLASYLQRLLAEHQVPYLSPLDDRQGKHVHLPSTAGKVEVLAKALLRAVGRGHDNELFVLMADLLDVREPKKGPDLLQSRGLTPFSARHLGPLLQAIKVARARHHHVLVVCPWPAGVPRASFKTTGDRPQATGPAPQAPEACSLKAVGAGLSLRLLDQNTAQKLHHAFHDVKQELARIGVPVVCARGEDPVAMILQRLDRLRMAGRHRR